MLTTIHWGTDDALVNQRLYEPPPSSALVVCLQCKRRNCDDLVPSLSTSAADPSCATLCSKHPAAELHAAARVLSGGGVYVSDAPGQHDTALLKRLVLPDGTILRALRPGRPTRDTLFRDVLQDGKSLLKARSDPGQCPQTPGQVCRRTVFHVPALVATSVKRHKTAVVLLYLHQGASIAASYTPSTAWMSHDEVAASTRWPTCGRH